MRKTTSILYITLGSISLILGILGVFLPVLPTTPFLLLTTTCYFKGSPRLYDWLLSHKHLGPYILNYRKYKAIPLRAKIISIVLLWVTILISAFLFIDIIPIRILLLLIATAVSFHILSFKTLEKINAEKNPHEKEKENISL